jgi:hypothetical protein
VPLLKADVDPRQTLLIPEIDVGKALTVTSLLAVQPADDVYIIFAVPDETPVTRPEELTVATEVLLLLHVPPVVTSLKCVVRPMQTVAVPVMDDGTLLTVTDTVAEHPATIA